MGDAPWSLLQAGRALSAADRTPVAASMSCELQGLLSAQACGGDAWMRAGGKRARVERGACAAASPAPGSRLAHTPHLWQTS